MKARKEITLAVIIGLLVGLVVVGGIIRARTALDNIAPQDLSFKARKASPSPSPKLDSLFLQLTTPDNQVLDTDSLIIEGSTLPGTYVVILGEKSEYIIVPNELGDFSQEIGLVAGANTIKITSYRDDGEQVETVLNAVYTTAEI